MNKVYAVIAILALVLLGAAGWGIHKYIQTAIENGLASCHFAGKIQNETIKQNAIDKDKIKTYNANAKEQKNEVAQKYITEPKVKSSDKCQNCEAKLKDILNAIHIFYSTAHNRP